MWELKEVQHRDMQTHILELFPEYARPEAAPTAAEKKKADNHVLDVSRQEHELRQECAILASKLSFILKSFGRTIEVSTIHAEAKRRFSKAQGDLSINELSRKRDWLIRCIDARKLL